MTREEVIAAMRMSVVPPAEKNWRDHQGRTEEEVTSFLVLASTPAGVAVYHCGPWPQKDMIRYFQKIL